MGEVGKVVPEGYVVMEDGSIRRRHPKNSDGRRMSKKERRRRRKGMKEVHRV